MERESLLAANCACGYPHQDYCGGELCDECESCGRRTPCDECAAEERERDLERSERLREEEEMLYGV